jgi:hypothetical protein
MINTCLCYVTITRDYFQHNCTQSSCTTNIGIEPNVSSELRTRQIIRIATTWHNSTTYASRRPKNNVAMQHNSMSVRQRTIQQLIRIAPLKLNRSCSFMLIEIVAQLQTKSSHSIFSCHRSVLCKLPPQWIASTPWFNNHINGLAYT